METLVETEMQQGVGVITLSRAEKRNALKREFIEQLIAAVDQLAGDPSLRVLILQARGSVFCAGMDLGEMQHRAMSDDGAAQWQRDSEVYARLLSKLFHLPVPTVVKLQGPVLAGGVGMVLACDLIVASENAFLMLPEPMRGITAAMVTPFLTFRAGAGIASQLLLSGQRITADRCHQLGLFHQQVAAADSADDNPALDQAIADLVASIGSGSRSAWKITKQHIHDCAAGTLDEQLLHSIGVSAAARETTDAREGLAAFLEKRDPVWA